MNHSDSTIYSKIENEVQSSKDITLFKLQVQGYETDSELQEIQFTPTHSPITV